MDMGIDKSLLFFIVFSLFSCESKNNFIAEKIDSSSEISKINTQNDFRYPIQPCNIKYINDKNGFNASIYVNTLLKSEVKGVYILKKDSLLLGVFFDDSKRNNENIFNTYKFTYNIRELKIENENNLKVCFLFDSLKIKYPNEKINYLR